MQRCDRLIGREQSLECHTVDRSTCGQPRHELRGGCPSLGGGEPGEPFEADVVSLPEPERLSSCPESDVAPHERDRGSQHAQHQSDEREHWALCEPPDAPCGSESDTHVGQQERQCEHKGNDSGRVVERDGGVGIPEGGNNLSIGAHSQSTAGCIAASGEATVDRADCQGKDESDTDDAKPAGALTRSSGLGQFGANGPQSGCEGDGSESGCCRDVTHVDSMSTGLSWWDWRVRAGDSSYGMDGAALLSMLVSLIVILWLVFPVVLGGDWQGVCWRTVVICPSFPILDWLFSRDWAAITHALGNGSDPSPSE